MPNVRDFVALCMKQRGDRYIFGAEARFSDPDPGVFDCSELVEWACHRIGVYVPDGSQNQRRFCRDHGGGLSVPAAIETYGALLFNNHHVAVSRGDGTTIEARGRAYGVNEFSAYNRGFLEGGLIPGLDYGTPLRPPVPKTCTPVAAKTPPKFHGTLKIGVNDSAAVKTWQGRMKARCWGITVDGDYGPASAEICREFQKLHDLEVDGIVGPITWAASWKTKGH